MNFESLIDKFQDDALSPQELSEFNRLLRDPGNRQRLREALWFEAALLEAAKQTSAELKIKPSAVPVHFVTEKDDSVTETTGQVRASHNWTTAVLAAAAAFGLIACVVLWQFYGPARPTTRAQAQATGAGADDMSGEDELAPLEWKSPEISADGRVTIRETGREDMLALDLDGGADTRLSGWTRPGLTWASLAPLMTPA